MAINTSRKQQVSKKKTEKAPKLIITIFPSRHILK